MQLWLKISIFGDKVSKPFKSYLGEDAVCNYIKSIIKESRYCGEVMKKHFNKDLSKAVDILSAAPGVAPNMLKALLIVSNTTATRSTVDREDPEPHWKAEKKPHFSR